METTDVFASLVYFIVTNQLYECSEISRKDYIDRLYEILGYIDLHFAKKIQQTEPSDCKITDCDYHKYCKERGQTDCSWKRG